LIQGKSANEAFYMTNEESNRRVRITGFSSIKYWIENDIESDDLE
jgi:hypothetical protein